MKRFFFIILLPLAALISYANSWIDPEWDELIRKSEVIGLFEVREGGANTACVYPQAVFKGQIENAIKIEDFNDALWSDDFMNERALKKGQDVYLFLYTSWKGTLRTSTPTTGILLLNGDHTVNYSLFNPTCSWEQPSHPKERFERFIQNAVRYQETGTPDPNTVKLLEAEIRDELAESQTNNIADLFAEYRICGGRNLIDGLESAQKHPAPETRYQTARLLGEMLPSGKAEDLLIQMLNDPHTLVQGEVVRQLVKSDDKEKIFKLLTGKLASALPGATGPDNIMDPVMNTSNGGLLEIIEQIGKHKYIEAENELIVLAKATKSPDVLRATCRALNKIGYTDLSGIITAQLCSDQKPLSDEAIRLVRDLPTPVTPEVRKALEYFLVHFNPNSYETGIIFPRLTNESLPALRECIIPILEHKTPKHDDLSYCNRFMELMESSSSAEMHELVDRILWYWAGINSQTLAAPELLKKKIDLEKYYQKLALENDAINLRKYKVTATTFVSLNTINPDEATTETPDHSFHIDLEMTVPADDPESPFDAIYASWNDHSIKSPLMAWREEIARQANIPVSNIGIFCHPSSGRGGRKHGTDDRTEKIIPSGYIDYVKRTDSAKHKQLIKLWLNSGFADYMGYRDQLQNILN